MIKHLAEISDLDFRAGQHNGEAEVKPPKEVASLATKSPS